MRSLFLVSIALTTATAMATSFYEQPFPDTVKSAAQIVRGKVGKSETQWATLPDGTKHLFTYYDIEVTEGLKGKPKAGASIRIRELGGEKDGVSLQVSGTAQFGVGEEIVVMLGEGGDTSDRAYPVMGMMMGKYNVEKGADGKEYLKGPGIGSSIHPALRNENSLSLDSLRETIRIQAAEGAEKRAVVASPKPMPNQEPLLSGTASQPGNAPFSIADENLTPPLSAHKGISFKPYLLAIGALIGTLWFLKNKKKRR